MRRNHCVFTKVVDDFSVYVHIQRRSLSQEIYCTSSEMLERAGVVVDAGIDHNERSHQTVSCSLFQLSGMRGKLKLKAFSRDIISRVELKTSINFLGRQFLFIVIRLKERKIKHFNCTTCHNSIFSCILILIWLYTK